MKKMTLIFMILLLFPIINNIDTSSSASFNENNKRSLKTWTFMIYLDGDNNLEDCAIEDFNELEMIANNDLINIIVLFDYNSEGTTTSTYRSVVSHDINMETINSSFVDLGEKDMANSSTLADFIDYCKLNYPAQNYYLSLWDHGSGVLSGNSVGYICHDETSNSYLTFEEIKNTLSTRHVNLLSLDACLCGMAEIAYDLQNVTDYIVFSEELMPGDGIEYQNAFKYIFNETTAQEIANQMVITYPIPNIDCDVTLSAVNMNYMPYLYDLINDLSYSLYGFSGSEYLNINNARISTLEFEETYYVDLYHFCENLIKNTNNTILSSKAQNVIDIFESLILANTHDLSNFDSHGLSIYFPKTVMEYYTVYESIPWSINTYWDEFIKSYSFASTQDHTSLQISRPEDITCEEGNNGKFLKWSTASINLDASHYTIYKNNTMFEEKIWDSEKINCSLAGLSVGNYNFTVILNDTTGLTISDEVMVNVIPDSSIPIINHPDNITIEQGVLDAILEWNTSDSNPYLFEIYDNGSLIKNDPWTNSQIIFSLSELNSGIHNITIVLIDIRGNKNIDTVFVKIIPKTLSSTSEDKKSPSFVGFSIFLGFLFIYMIRKKTINK